MVACKSTVRERWGQILKEADRIQEKYLLTVDEGLSADLIESMGAAHLRVFMPSAAIESRYGANPSKGLLGTVAGLLMGLKSVL